VQPDAASPARPAALDAMLARLDGGSDLRTALERILVELEPEHADALMLLTKEGRGAWFPLLSGQGGRALFLGNAFSGTITALGMAGYDVTTLDTSRARLRFNAWRHVFQELPGTSVQGGKSARLPFRDAAFELVVQEDGLPSARNGWGHDTSELERVCARELVLIARNRFAYKRSTGQRGVFQKMGPRTLLGRNTEERSLRGYRQLFRSFEATRVFSLYPDAGEFSHIVSLDEAHPRLTIGPRERKNRLKLVGKRLGLFPWLTPSFAVIGSRSANPTARIRRMLGAIAERLAVPTPGIDIIVATRSNTSLIHTRPSADHTGWTLRLSTSPSKQRLNDLHHDTLQLIEQRFPTARVPRPLFEGELEGVRVSCEQRLPGWTAPDITGCRAESARMFSAVARALAELVVREPQVMSADVFEAEMRPRFERVARYAGDAGAIRTVHDLCAQTQEALVGRTLPRVLYHADLRPKHVQVQPTGELVGLLDWGASERSFLPYADLVTLIAFHRKQEERSSPRAIWERIRSLETLDSYERDALEEYAALLDLDEDYCRALRAIFPLLVGDMAERNWDYSRPLWLKRQYLE